MAGLHECHITVDNGSMTLNLFQDEPREQGIAPGATLLRGAALAQGARLVEAVEALTRQSPFRHMMTPGGFTMSVAMTNCGGLGWITDRRGYRYVPDDPETGQPWPAMPEALAALARGAAQEAGFAGFQPDACLINRYVPGTRLTLHQDGDEVDFSAPIVSVSLGIPATFLFGGCARKDKTARVPLFHGDVVVWGGVDRKRYHGVMPLKEAVHPLVGAQRMNLTFRKAG